MVIEKFNNCCQPRKNLTFLIHKFFTCKQKDHQRFDDHVMELRSKANQCDFGEISNRLIKDMLVCGQRDNALWEIMLWEPDLTLGKAMQAGQSAEEKRQTELMSKTPETDNIDSVQKRGRNSGKFKYTRIEGDKRADRSKQEDRKPKWINNCTYCSTAHNKSNCSAYNKNCGKCGKRGYFAKMCRCKNKNPRKLKTHDRSHYVYEHHLIPIWFSVAVCCLYSVGHYHSAGLSEVLLYAGISFINISNNVILHYTLKMNF